MDGGDVHSVEVKFGEPVTLMRGDHFTFSSTTIWNTETGELVSQHNGPAYVERDGVLVVYQGWQARPVDASEA